MLANVWAYSADQTRTSLQVELGGSAINDGANVAAEFTEEKREQLK